MSSLPPPPGTTGPSGTSADLLKVLHEVTALGDGTMEERFTRALQQAAHALGMDTGAIGRVKHGELGGRWVHPAGGPILPGQTVRLTDAYASLVYALDRTVTLQHVGSSAHAQQPFYRRQRYEAYVGTIVLVSGHRYGVLDFLSSQPRQAEFTEEELAFVELLADWVGWTLERSHIGGRLRRSDDEIERMYHTLCHELKTPLTSMREFISILLDEIAGPLNAEQREYLEQVRSGTDALTRHLNDLIDVSRLDSGKLSCHPKPTDLVDALERAVSWYRRELQDTGLTLQTQAADRLPPAYVDPVRISQVIQNLLANAIRFTPAGGTISITIEPEASGRWIVVSLRDTGLGIAAEHLGRVFDRLYQVTDGEWGTQGGLGLGLHLARELIRLHGGEIWVESEVGKGSTFTFTVPAHGRPATPPAYTRARTDASAR